MTIEEHVFEEASIVVRGISRSRFVTLKKRVFDKAFRDVWGISSSLVTPTVQCNPSHRFVRGQSCAVCTVHEC